MTDAPERITIARKVGSSNTWDVVGVYSERVMSMGYIGPVLYARADLAPQWHRMDDPDNPPPKCQPVLADYGGVIRIVSCSFTRRNPHATGPQEAPPRSELLGPPERPRIQPQPPDNRASRSTVAGHAAQS